VSWSTSARGGVLDTLLDGAYLALYTAEPSDAGGGTELTGDSYSRQAVTFERTDAVAVNDAEVNFDCEGEDWGEIGWAALFDAPTDGNFLMWEPLGTPRTVEDGDSIQLAAGAIVVELT
jgi:hypothetical protein